MSSEDLYDAAVVGDESKVKQLLQMGVHPDHYRGVLGLYALHEAALYGHTSVVRSLLDAGAQVEVVDDAGNTPLHWACDSGHADTARILLDAGAQLQVVNNVSNTPLHMACAKDNANTTRTQLESHTGVSRKDTLLHDVTTGEHLLVVKLLVEHYGGDALLHTKGYNNETPLEKAQSNNCSTIVTYLQQARVRQLAVPVTPTVQHVTHYSSSRKAKSQNKIAATKESFCTPFGEYKVNFKEPLGRGTYGEVYRAQHINGGEVVALKRVSWQVDTALLPVDPKREVETYRSVPEHPNILKLFDSMLHDRELVLVTELCDAGDLETYFIENSPALVSRIDLMKQASCGFLHLHNQKPPIVHRDIKPQNLLLKWSEGQLLIKIADFGFARTVDQNLMKTLCGTLSYIAPDVLPDVETEFVQYTKECDIFSLGLVFQAMVLHKQGNNQLIPKLDVPPDPNKGPAQQMRDAKKDGLPMPGVAHIGDPNDFVLEQLDLLVQWMTRYTPAERIDFTTVQAILCFLKKKITTT